MTVFVNVHGEPIDFKALGAKAAAHRAIVGPKPKRNPTVPKGYAALPGTGPEGKTCRDCQHKQTMSNTGAKSWIKCVLMKAAWTSAADQHSRTPRRSPAGALKPISPDSVSLPPWNESCTAGICPHQPGRRMARNGSQAGTWTRSKPPSTEPSERMRLAGWL